MSKLTEWPDSMKNRDDEVSVNSQLSALVDPKAAIDMKTARVQNKKIY